MINNARSLILNKSEGIAGLASGNPGAELIDSTFAPLILPEGLNKVRNILLPPEYNAYQINCTLSYIMRILHMPDLVNHTLLFDGRYTYDLRTDFTTQLRDESIVTEIWKTNVCDMTVAPVYQARYKLGQQGNVTVWRLTYDPNMGKTMRLQCNNATAYQITPVFKNTVATIVLIPDYLAIRLVAPTGVPTGNLRYTLTFYAPVEANISKWLTDFEHSGLQQSISAVIFDPWEPYVAEGGALQSIWLHNSESLLRVGAFILGYVYQCERVRRGLYVTKASTLQKVR